MVATVHQLNPWLTPEQAAEYLGLPTVKALYQRVRRGDVPAHRLGRSLRFRQTDLDRAMEGSDGNQ